MITILNFLIDASLDAAAMSMVMAFCFFFLFTMPFENEKISIFFKSWMQILLAQVVFYLLVWSMSQASLKLWEVMIG